MKLFYDWKPFTVWRDELLNSGENLPELLQQSSGR